MIIGVSILSCLFVEAYIIGLLSYDAIQKAITPNTTLYIGRKHVPIHYLHSHKNSAHIFARVKCTQKKGILLIRGETLPIL